MISVIFRNLAVTSRNLYLISVISFVTVIGVRDFRIMVIKPLGCRINFKIANKCFIEQFLLSSD